MSDIGPGDFVECVRFRGWNAGHKRACRPEEMITVGAIYQVAWAGPHPGDGEPCLLLRERGPGDYYSAECFRPIYRPNADLIRDLMQPVDDGVPA